MNARGVLSTLARHGAYGIRAALQGPPASQEPRHGPPPPKYCDPPDPRDGAISDAELREALEGGRDLAVEKGWLTPEQADDAVGQVLGAGALPMRGSGDPSCVPGSRASTMAWAEAISQAGAALSDEGHEDEAIKCFIVAGSLLEKVEQWGKA